MWVTHTHSHSRLSAFRLNTAAATYLLNRLLLLLSGPSASHAFPVSRNQRTLPVVALAYEEMDIGLHVSCVWVEWRGVAGEDLCSWAGVGKRLQRFLGHAANPGCRRGVAEEG